MPIARIALPVAAATSFDYWIPEGLPAARGAIVRARLASRLLTGVVMEVIDRSEIPRERLQPIEAAVRELPALAPDLLELGAFVASYYQEPLGLVIALMLPPIRPTTHAVRSENEPRAPLRFTARGETDLPATLARAPRLQALHETWRQAPDSILTTEAQSTLSPHLKSVLKKWIAAGFVERVSPTIADRSSARATNIATLNDDQQRALATIPLAQHTFAPFLLQGVTGSGKTEVYLAAAATAIGAGRQVLILVPEINLTPQFHQRIADALPGRRAVMLHSRLSASERLRHWRAAAAGEIDVVLGTRLAVFAPLPRLGLICRRRGARSLVQATGRREVQRSRCRRVARATTQGADSARQRDAGSRDARACAARALRVAQVAAARDCAGGSSTNQLCVEPRRGHAGGNERRAPRSHRAAPRARRADARLHQPPRIRAVAALWIVRMARRLSRVQRAPGRSP
jgi:primosomal protein N'